jgi:hypothetical protein
MNGDILRKGMVAKRASAWQLVLVSFLVLVLVFQGYATQSHIHKQDISAASIALKANGTAPGHKNAPTNDDPANCPICQQFMHAGQYVAPAWLTPLLLILAISTVEITTVDIPHFDTVSHNWRGRGPPLS